MAAVVEGLREPWLGPLAAWLGPRAARPGPLAAWPGPRAARRGPRCRRPGPLAAWPGPRCRRPGPRCRRPGPRCRRPGPRCPAEVRGLALAAQAVLHFPTLAAQPDLLRPRGSAPAVRRPGRASAPCGPKRAAAPGLPPRPACRGPSCPTARPRSPVRPELAADSPGGLRRGPILPHRAWPAGPAAVIAPARAASSGPRLSRGKSPAATGPAWAAIAPRRFPVI